MANEPVVAAPAAPVTPTPTPAPSPAPVVAPPTSVGEAVAPAPVLTAPVVAPVTETPPAPVVEAPVKAPETLLGDNKPVEAPKAPEAVVETPKEEKAKEGQSVEPAPPPVYDSFKVPEGVTLDTERVSEFTKTLAELEQSGKVPHELVQQFGQKAVDMYVTEVKKATDALTQEYVKIWDKQKVDWKDSFLKDPEIGGNRFQTTVDSALTFIRTHGGTTEQQTEFRNLMESSGLGNHPAMIRLLANAGRTMAEGTPLAASKPAPVQKSKVETMYGKG